MWILKGKGSLEDIKNMPQNNLNNAICDFKP